MLTRATGLGGPEAANQTRFASSWRNSGRMRAGVSSRREASVASMTIWDASSSRRRALPGESSARTTLIALRRDWRYP